MITNSPDDNTRPSESPNLPPKDRDSLDRLPYEQVEALFNLRISSSGNDITISLGGESMTVDYEAFQILRDSILAWHRHLSTKEMLEARIDEAKVYYRAHPSAKVAHWVGNRIKKLEAELAALTREDNQ